MSNQVKFDAMRLGDKLEFLSDKQIVCGPCKGTIAGLTGKEITITITDPSCNVPIKLRRDALLLDQIKGGKQSKDRVWSFY